MQEEWRYVKGYEGMYLVSNFGNVKSLDRPISCKGRKDKLRIISGKMKKPTLNDKGYLKVTLFKNGHGKTREIQRIVAETFIPNPMNKPQVNHIDGNKTNNCVDNLEWATSHENMWHSANVLKNALKAVDQYDLKGNYIATYESAIDAARKNHIKPCSISNVIYGRRNKAGGYVWKMTSGILTPRER